MSRSIFPIAAVKCCRYIFIPMLSFFITAFFLSSCTREEKADGYIHYRLGANPTSLDPALVVDVTGGVISGKLFNGLVKLDNELKIIPDIAEKWEMKDKGLAYFFYLKKGVRFSNGREVTAHDFKYSFERLLSPGNRSPNTWVLDKISGVKCFMEDGCDEVPGIEVVGRYTLKITLESPFSPFLNLLTMTAAYVVPKEEVEKLGDDFSSHPVGTGPFVLTAWDHNSSLALSRNEDYFDDKARVKGIVYRIIPEELTAVAEFELGNLDVITIPSYEYARYQNSLHWKNYISSVEGLNTYYLGFNCSRPPFDNIRLRRAVASSIDRAKILRTFYEGRGRLANGPVPDVLRTWKSPVPVDYDPERAARVIEEEGMRGKAVRFYITADREIVDIAEIIQSYLTKVGLRAEIVQLEWSAYKEALNRGEADIFWISWWADYPDPENFLFPLFHSQNHGAGGNRSRYTNKDVDGLIEAGQQAISGRDRDLYYMRAESLIVQEAPWVFFWHKRDFTLRHPRVKNYKMYAIYTRDKGVEVSF
jgi:peptide/nickel transport system substrate-binding protein/oligopeptide transport system substrate-binding protein